MENKIFIYCPANGKNMLLKVSKVCTLFALWFFQKNLHLLFSCHCFTNLARSKQYFSCKKPCFLTHAAFGLPIAGQQWFSAISKNQCSFYVYFLNKMLQFNNNKRSFKQSNFYFGCVGVCGSLKNFIICTLVL